MALVDPQDYTSAFRGKTGKNFVFKEINGKTYATKIPDRSNVIYVEEQLAYRDLFKEASQYASAVLADPEKKAVYVKKGLPHNRVYHAAFRDYFRQHSWKLKGDWLEVDPGKHISKFPGLNARQKKAIEYLAEKNTITNALYQKINKISKTSATRDLQDLVERKAVIFNGIKGAGAAYILPGDAIDQQVKQWAQIGKQSDQNG